MKTSDEILADLEARIEDLEVEHGFDPERGRAQVWARPEAAKLDYARYSLLLQLRDAYGD